MKVLIFIAGFSTVMMALPSVCGRGSRGRGGGQHGPEMLAVSSDMIGEILEMPIKKMDYYSEGFYPGMIQMINRKLYSRKARSRDTPTEKRIRNIKLNAFLNIPNDRQAPVQRQDQTQNDHSQKQIKSSYPFLSKSKSTSFVVYTVSGKNGGQQLIDIRSPDLACLFGMSEERTAVKAKACREDVPNMTWDLIPNKYGDFWVRQQGTKLCLVPVLTMGQPVILQLLPCSRHDPFQIWEIQDAYMYYKKK